MQTKLTWQFFFLILVTYNYLSVLCCQGCASKFEDDVQSDADVVMGVCFSLGILNVKQLSLLFIVLPLLCSLYHRTLPNFRFVNACSLDICVSYGECALGRSAKGTMYNHVHVGYSVCDAVDGSQYCVAADRHFHLVLHQGSTGGGE